MNGVLYKLVNHDDFAEIVEDGKGNMIALMAYDFKKVSLRKDDSQAAGFMRMSWESADSTDRPMFTKQNQRKRFYLL